MVRHWVQRWWLARDLLPLDALPFLELATRLGCWRRRAGGGLQFFHRLLQEQIAMRPGLADDT